MAAAFVPEIWASRLTDKLRSRLIWANLCNRNWEGEVQNYGDRVRIPTSTTTVTTRSYTVGTDIADPQTTSGTTQTLIIDQQTYWNLKVDDIVVAQSRVDELTDAVDEAGYQLAVAVDTYTRGIIDGAYNVARRTSQINSHPLVTDAMFGTAFIKALTATKKAMSKANIPPEQRWVVVNPEILEGLENFFLTNPNPNVFVGATQEDILRNGIYYAGKMLSFDLYVSGTIPDANAISSKAAWRVWAGQGRSATTFASQLTKVESYRLEKQFADGVRGLYLYAAKVIHGGASGRLWNFSVQKAA